MQGAQIYLKLGCFGFKNKFSTETKTHKKLKNEWIKNIEIS
jgi:hypothetical protein